MSVAAATRRPTASAIGSRSPSRPPRDDDPVAPGQVRPHAHARRTRVARASARDLVAPASRRSRPPTRRPAGATRAPARTSRSSSVEPADQRERRIGADLGGEVVAILGRRRRAGCSRRGRRTRGARAAAARGGRPARTSTSSPSRVGVRPRELDAPRRQVGRPDRARPGRSSFTASAIAPGARADVDDDAASSTRRDRLERDVDEDLGLGPRDEHARAAPPARAGGTPARR